MAAEAAGDDLKFLGAPVVGQSMTTERETLTIEVGGDAKMFKKHSHIFSTVVKTIFHVGSVVRGVG